MALSAVSRLRRPSRADLFWSVARGDRVRLTCELVATAGRAVVFCRTATDAARVAGELSRHGVPAAVDDQRDFHSSRIRALVVTDESALSCPRNAAWCVVQFDPAATPRRYRRRIDLVAAPGAVVISFVVPERRLDADRLLERLDGDGVTGPDVPAVRPALLEARAAAERAAARRASDDDAADVAPLRPLRPSRNGADASASDTDTDAGSDDREPRPGGDGALWRVVSDASGRAAVVARGASARVRAWSRSRRRSG